MSVGVVGRWLTKKWETQFTQEVEGGLTNFKKVLVFSSYCCTTCFVVWVPWNSKIRFHDEPPQVSLLSNLHDQDVVQLAKQQCHISKSLHTTSLPSFTQRETPFHSLESIVTHTRAVPNIIHTLCIQNNYSNSTLCSSNCEDEPWQTWASYKQVAAFSQRSSSRCYDNLIIVCHGCAVVLFPFVRE